MKQEQNTTAEEKELEKDKQKKENKFFGQTGRRQSQRVSREPNRYSPEPIKRKGKKKTTSKKEKDERKSE